MPLVMVKALLLLFSKITGNFTAIITINGAAINCYPFLKLVQNVAYWVSIRRQFHSKARRDRHYFSVEASWPVNGCCNVYSR